MNGPLLMSIEDLREPRLSDRREYAFAVALELTERFAAGVAANLPVDPHRRSQHGPARGAEDDSRFYVTTLYFDSHDHAIARACENHHEHIKLRAREYHDIGAAPDGAPEPILWFEVKARSGMRTRKLRLSIPTGEAGGWLRDGAVDTWLLHMRDDAAPAAHTAILREMIELSSKTTGPLQPTCLAHYRRRAWQDSSGSTRVTLDTELAFHRASPEFFNHHASLSDALREPAQRMNYGVIELKLRGECPNWLDQLLRSIGVEIDAPGIVPYSKFLAASAAVSGC